MADPAQFGHDRLGHLLSDELLKVPRFQRRFSWQEEEVNEYWDDVQRALGAGQSYFMGTVVLAQDTDNEHRKLVIDGQQRITTTAILLVAIRDRLRELGQVRSAQSVEDKYLSDYVLEEEETVAKLTLNPVDYPAFSALLAGNVTANHRGLVVDCYSNLKRHVDEYAPSVDEYRRLIELVTFMDKNVQVLLAVATGLAEAYVIFETLNDRGADLTTADLLKNYVFSQAGSSGITYAEDVWIRISSKFEKSDDLVKFLRYEYMSRQGRVTNRGLYKAIQADIGEGAKSVKSYLEGIEGALARYTALREPDDSSWSSQAIEVKDSLLAYRRFGFESSMPLLMAAFAKWTHSDATRFVDTVAAWSVRALVSGKLGGGQSEAAFCAAAMAVSNGTAHTVDDVRPYVLDIVPDDPTFEHDFTVYGSITTTRAKYLLARLERQRLLDDGNSTDAMPDWSSKSVSVEHIYAKSMQRAAFRSDDEFNTFNTMKDSLQNLTLLERTLNTNLDNRPFEQKVTTYASSAFVLTREVGDLAAWGMEAANARARELAELAVKAWPR